MSFYEIVASFIARSADIEIIFLLIGAYFVALGFRMAKLNRFALAAAVPLLFVALIFSSSHVIILPAIVVMYYSVLRQAKIKQKNSIYQQQLQFYEEYLQEREANYQHGKVLQHDQRQHFGYLLSAMENNRIEEGITYVKTLIQDVFLGKPEATNNFVINSILSIRSEKMRENEITLLSEIEVPEQVHVNDVDFCIILGNLLDNAIEATRRVPADKRVINLRIRYDAGVLLVDIKNSHVNALKKGGLGGFASSKCEQGQHGLGLYSVRQTLEKYNGILQTEVDADRFITIALLYGAEEF